MSPSLEPSARLGVSPRLSGSAAVGVNVECRAPGVNYPALSAVLVTVASTVLHSRGLDTAGQGVTDQRLNYSVSSSEARLGSRGGTEN